MISHVELVKSERLSNTVVQKAATKEEQEQKANTMMPRAESVLLPPKCTDSSRALPHHKHDKGHDST